MNNLESKMKSTLIKILIPDFNSHLSIFNSQFVKLWAAFPAQSPYNYAYNSPLIFSDPSGLAPEKEKDREELMSLAQKFDFEKIYEAIQNCREENGKMASQKVGGYCSESSFIIHDIMSRGFTYYEALEMYSHGSRRGNGGSVIGLTPFQQSKVELMITLDIGSGVSNGVDIKKNFWSSFWEANLTMTKKQYEFCTSGNITVDFVSDSEFAAKSSSNGKANATGWHSGVGGKSTITLKASHFSSNTIDNILFNHVEVIDGVTKNVNKIDRIDILQHEFGHAFAYYLLGDEYNTWDDDYKENWAFWYVNETYRIPNGMNTWAFWGGFKNEWPFTIFIKGRNPNTKIKDIK